MSVGFQNLYFSSDPRALEASFITYVIQTRRKDPLASTHILVPNHHAGAHLRHKIAEQQALVNLRFVTWKDLACQVLQFDAAFLAKTKLTPEMELFHIAQIAKKTLRNTEMESVSDKRGFHLNLKNLFRHMISASTERIPNINHKTNHLDQMFRQYLELKKKHHTDVWLLDAASKIQKIPNISHLMIHGLTKLSGLEIRFLTHISKVASVDLWLERLFFEDLQEDVFTWAGSSFESTQEIEEVHSPEISATTSISAFHIQDEAALAAQSIVDFEKNKATPLNRIGIFLNHYSRQRSYFEHALRAHNIAFVSFNGTPMIQTALGKAIQALTEILFQNWKRDAWMNFLQAFPFKFVVLDRIGTPTQWDEWTVQAQITTKSPYMIARLEALHEKAKDEKLAAFIDFQKKFIARLECIEESHKEDMTLFFEQLWIWIQEHADASAVLNEHAIFFEDLIYFSKSIQTAMPWSELHVTVSDKLAHTFVQDKTFDSDGVFIAPISMLVGMSFDLIITPHVNEGCFPKNISPSFDLSPLELFEVAQKSGVRFAGSEHDFEMQRILFASIPQRCNKHIASFAKYAIPRQEELRRSVFLHDEKLRAFENTSAVSSVLFQENNPFTKHIHAYHQALYANEWSGFNALVAETPNKKVYSASDFSNYIACPRKYFLSKVLKLSDKDNPEDRFEINPGDKGNLIHAILFKIFSVLRDQKLLPLDAKNEANIIHIAQTLTNDAFDAFAATHAVGSEEIWNIDREELLKDVTEYMIQEIQTAFDWTPHAFEYRFGMRGFDDQDDPLSSDLAVSLPVVQKQIQFRGKVDRMDLSADKQRMRIIDYKTGKKFEHVNWNYQKGENIQIPLYMLLAKYFFKDIQPAQVEGQLIHLKSSSNFDRRTLSHQQLSTRELEILELLNLADGGIQRGMFYPNPGNNMANCKNCDFGMFCGSNIDRDIESIPVHEFMHDFKKNKDALK